MRVFYSQSYVLAAHSFDTTRKAAWIVDSLLTHPFPGVTVEAPTPLTASDVEVVHDHVYVDAVRTGTPLNYAESLQQPTDFLRYLLDATSPDML